MWSYANKLELELSAGEAGECCTMKKRNFSPSLACRSPVLDRLIRTAYHNARTSVVFSPPVPDETRAWTCHIGYIPGASRAIHTDFERLFIRAEVINWQDLLRSGGYGPACAKRSSHITVGKDYIVKDGDVVEILMGK